MDRPWKTDKWFVSPWNYEPEVTNQFDFAKEINIHDVSLRDGEQQTGLVFNRKDKLKIAESLAKVGVHRIEAGMPAVSKEDEQAIKDIVKENFGPRVFAFARCMKDDIKRAADCGVDGVVVEIPSSSHIIENAYGWSLEKAIDLSVKATQYAHECGLYTVFFPIDATRSDMSWYLDLIERVSQEGHMDALALVDTFGGISPYAVPYMVRKIKSRIQKPLEAHFHNDFGLGVANTIAALASGVEVAHTSITGIGERAGNAAYEEVALALLTMFNQNVGLHFDQIYETSKVLQEISDIRVSTARSIVGDHIFDIESGIVAGWMENLKGKSFLQIAPFIPELVGQHKPNVVLGKNSGASSIRMNLENIGVRASEKQIEQLSEKVKLQSFKAKRLITSDEFKRLVEEVVK